VQQAIYIFDLSGLGARHLWPYGLEAFKNFAIITREHTAEIIYKLIVINGLF
jgi:hypothetical protein